MYEYIIRMYLRITREFQSIYQTQYKSLIISVLGPHENRIVRQLAQELSKNKENSRVKLSSRLSSTISKNDNATLVIKLATHHHLHVRVY